MLYYTQGGDFVGFLFEIIGDLLFDMWFAVMQWIIPVKMIGERARYILKIIIGIFSCLLLITMVLGLFAIISEDTYTKQIGKYMVFIPLGISAVQILIGIIVRSISKKKRQRKSGF